MTGCPTTPKNDGIKLPPKPTRQKIDAPQTLQDYARIINYYEHLVQEWEEWGDTVSLMIEQ